MTLEKDDRFDSPAPEALRLARSMQRLLTGHDTTFAVKVSGSGGGGSSPEVSLDAVPCIFIIRGPNSAKHAEELSRQGCNCLSSGEDPETGDDEFTCDCPDE